VVDPDKDVDRHPYSKQQMSGGHGWPGPEGNQEASVDRVANQLVEQGRAHCRCGWFIPRPTVPRLRQTKQFEVVDQPGADENDTKPGQEQAPNQIARQRIANVPDYDRDRVPEPIKQCENDSRSEAIEAALQRRRNDPGPGGLEGWPRHHAVLQAEQGNQAKVPGRCGDGIGDDPFVNMGGKHWQAGQEPHKIDERHKEC
jgi:hypothetical protein